MCCALIELMAESLLMLLSVRVLECMLSASVLQIGHSAATCRMITGHCNPCNISVFT